MATAEEKATEHMTPAQIATAAQLPREAKGLAPWNAARNRFATASETGAALVVSTHDAAVAERLGRQWQIADGKLIGVDRQEASCSA